MKAVATTLVREDKFDTSDFATAKERDSEGFVLLVSQARVDSCNDWLARFSEANSA